MNPLATLPTGRARAGLTLALAATALLRAGEATGRLPTWAASWGDDFVCLPLLLTTALLAHRLLGRAPAWRLPVVHGLAAVVLYAVLFEVLLPAVGARATADPWDVAAYGGGWVFFQAVINVAAETAPAT